MRTLEQIHYADVKAPDADGTGIPVLLSDETMEKRYKAVMSRMEEAGLDTLVIYADLEHGHNFAFLTGFLPRFEEAVLVLNRSGNHYMLMGNENLNKVPSARIRAVAIHVPCFSLPNQPMDGEETLSDILKAAEIDAGKRVGIVGWKNFTSKKEDNSQLFDVPSYLVDAIKAIVCPEGEVLNAAYIFIGHKGVRCVNNPNELAHYEFGAALASDCMLKAMNHLDAGVSELELGADLQALGQRNSVVTIAATGKRFEKANLYPLAKNVKLADTISLTVGYRGGLSSRSGYAVHDEAELPVEIRDYLDKVVKPYYRAVVVWLEEIHCGMRGGDMYSIIEGVLPKSQYHWTLCPGHLTADEEWMSSPIYKDSGEILESGMLFQIDIIPSVSGYGGTSAESTIALADQQLRAQLQREEPKLWERIVKRRAYMEQILGIRLPQDVLPMCSTVAYLRPFLLEKSKAMCVK